LPTILKTLKGAIFAIPIVKLATAPVVVLTKTQTKTSLTNVMSMTA